MDSKALVQRKALRGMETSATS